MVDFENALRVALKTGKVVIGFNKTKKTIQKGKPKLVIIASNAPSEISEEIKYFCKLANVPYYIYNGSGYELGAVCGKPFIVSVMAVEDPGDSEILSFAR